MHTPICQLGEACACSAAYVPPPPELVEGLLLDLVAYANEDEHPALVRACRC